MPPKRSKISAEVHGPSKDPEESGSEASLSSRMKKVVAQNKQLKSRSSSRQRPESTWYAEDTYETPPKQR
jgi:hypothetical protein